MGVLVNKKFLEQKMFDGEDSKDQASKMFHF